MFYKILKLCKIIFVQKFPPSLLYNTAIVVSEFSSYWAELHYGFHEIRQINLVLFKLVEVKNPLININLCLKLNLYISLTVHLSITLTNDQPDAQIFNTFITILYMYMFRAISCSSSGGQIVLIQHLVSSLSISDRPVYRLREDPVLSQPVHRTVTY